MQDQVSLGEFAKSRLLFRLAEKVAGCVPWYLPRLWHHAVCDPWTQREFTAVLERSEDRTECGHCLADREYTDYSVAASKARIRSISTVL